MLDLAFFKDGTRLLPPTARVNNLRFGSGRHGFAALEAELPMAAGAAIDFYDAVVLADVRVMAQDGSTVWRGRVEDVAIGEQGLRIGAFGYARAMSDLLYTALWSVTGVANWRAPTEDEVSVAFNERYELDQNNRIYIAIKQNEYSSLSNRGIMVYELPDRGGRDAMVISGYVEAELTDSYAWIIDIQAYDDSWTPIGTAGTIALLNLITPSISQSWSYSAPLGTQKLGIRFSRDGGTPTQYTGDTGGTFAKITDLRIKSTASSTVVASEIVGSLVADVAAVNGDQISTSTAAIATTSTDLRDEIYMDMRHADVLERLATRERFWWGVWADMRLFFATPSAGGRELVVDVAAVSFEGGLEGMANRTYATYTNAGGRVRRTAVANNTAVQERIGLVRMSIVQAETTSNTEAGAWRDALLLDEAAYKLRADVVFERIYTALGARLPLAAVRAGDTITMRNLPATLDERVLAVRSFRVGASDFDAIRNALRVAPDEPSPTLVTLIAKRGR